jgi:hypothetical protein
MVHDYYTQYSYYNLNALCRNIQKRGTVLFSIIVDCVVLFINNKERIIYIIRVDSGIVCCIILFGRVSDRGTLK